MSVQKLYELASQALTAEGKFTDAFYYEGQAKATGKFRLSTYYAQIQPGWRKDGPVRAQMATFLANERAVLAIQYGQPRRDLLVAHPRDLEGDGSNVWTELLNLLRQSGKYKPQKPVAFFYDPVVLVEDNDPLILSLCASLQ